jgi:class 3 adenylate cyclase
VTGLLPGHGASAAGSAFAELIDAYAGAKDAAARAGLEEKIWARFGAEGTVFISDMASFSHISRARGICHYLALISRVRLLLAPLIARHGGRLLKCEADNCYAFFERPDDALATAVSAHDALAAANAGEPVQARTYLSVGIDHGRLLLIGDEDFYGDPVNTASKLGEDLAGKGETLVTRQALERCAGGVEPHGASLKTRISEIEIEYYRFRHG